MAHRHTCCPATPQLGRPDPTRSTEEEHHIYKILPTSGHDDDNVQEKPKVYECNMTSGSFIDENYSQSQTQSLHDRLGSIDEEHHKFKVIPMPSKPDTIYEYENAQESLIIEELYCQSGSKYEATPDVSRFYEYSSKVFDLDDDQGTLERPSGLHNSQLEPSRDEVKSNDDDNVQEKPRVDECNMTSGSFIDENFSQSQTQSLHDRLGSIDEEHHKFKVLHMPSKPDTIYEYENAQESLIIEELYCQSGSKYEATPDVSRFYEYSPKVFDLHDDQGTLEGPSGLHNSQLEPSRVEVKKLHKKALFGLAILVLLTPVIVNFESVIEGPHQPSSTTALTTTTTTTAATTTTTTTAATTTTTLSYLDWLKQMYGHKWDELG